MAALRAKVQHFEHYVLGGIILIVVAFIGYNWWRSKRHKPALTDKVLTRVEHRIESHEKSSATVSRNPETLGTEVASPVAGADDHVVR